MTFGQRLRETRESQEMTRTKLAAKAHTSRSSLEKYEYDTAIPSIYAAADIARALGVSLDWLVTGKERK